MKKLGALMLIAVLLSGCGGGGGGGGTSSGLTVSSGGSGGNGGGGGGGSTRSVFGTAATGAAIAGAEVTLVDAEGVTANAVTGPDGGFEIPTDGLQPPYLLRVEFPGGGHLYSVCFDDGLTNINDFTHFVMLGASEAAVFELATAFQGAPDWVQSMRPEAILLIQALVLESLYAHLSDVGLDADPPDFFTDPWDFSLPVDGLLDEADVRDDGTFVITGPDGRVSECTFSLEPGGVLKLRVVTTRAGGGGTSEEEFTTLVPTEQGPVTDAFLGVLERLDDFRGRLMHESSTLTAETFHDDLAADFIHDGRDRSTYAAYLATHYRDATVRFLEPLRITTHDSAQGLIEVLLRIAYDPPGGGGTNYDLELISFRQEGDTWRMVGNRRIAECRAGGARIRTVTPQGATESIAILLEVTAPQWRGLTGGTVGLEGFPDATLVASGTRTVRLHPTRDTTLDVVLDVFTASVPIGGHEDVPVSPAIFRISDVSGHETLFHVPVAGLPDESTHVAIEGASGEELPASMLGRLLTVSWNMPRHFPVTSVEVRASASNASHGEEDVVVPELTEFSHTVDLTFPATVDGDPVTSVQIEVIVHGADGQVASAISTWNVP